MFLHLLLLANGPPPFSATPPPVGAIQEWLPLLPLVAPIYHCPTSAKSAKSHINMTFGFFYDP